MLKRIYIDNFRCLVNFVLDVDTINLFLGSNGAGKSTVFEVLQKIQAFVSGDSKVEGIFKPTDCTRWQTSPIQRFELEIRGNGGSYKYELGIGHDRDKCRVEYERLWYDNQPLLKFELGEVQLYRDDFSEGSQYSFDWSQSIFPSLMPRSDNRKLTWFRERMARFIIVRIIPSLMVDESSQEEMRLAMNMENFVSWYRYLSEDQGKVAEIGNILRDVLDGFTNFRFQRVSEQSLVLKLRFSGGTNSNKPIEYRLGELSDHPRLINYLLVSPIGYWFERQSNAPVRVKRISSEVADNSGLPVSELIARGWLDESA